MHVDNWSSACLRREVWHIRNLWMSTGCTGTNRWRCHNCCCGKRAVENLTWYRTVIGTGPTECPQSTSWPSVWSTALLAERARVSRQSFSSPIVLITTRRPWFGHLIPCALRQWRKLNFSGHKLYNIFVFFKTDVTLRRACAIFFPLYKLDRDCGRYKFKPSADKGKGISRFIHRICYPLRDRIVKLVTELACLLEYHVLYMNTVFEEKTSHAAEVNQEALADYATELSHCIILPDRAAASHHA
jgi:hypothetical protein